MTDNLLNDNQDNGSSEEVINNDGQPSTIENATPENGVTISKEELEALKIKAEKFDKKEGDFEKAFKKEKEKRADTKAPEFDEETIIAKATARIREENFLANKGITSEEDVEFIKNSAKVLGASLQDVYNNEIVLNKLKENAQSRATKAAEDDISLNSVFANESFLGDDAFKQGMLNGTINQSADNLERLQKLL